MNTNGGAGLDANFVKPMIGIRHEFFLNHIVTSNHDIDYAFNIVNALPAIFPAKRLSTLSAEGKARLLSKWGEPLFLASWLRVLFIHFEVDAMELQRDVPFPLDLLDGRAYVSLVAFTMQDMRPRIGGKMTSWLLKPIATHEFLNVRTYVKSRGERGIYFLTEWLSNRLSVRLGPLLYGLPYRYAGITYRHPHEQRRVGGELGGVVESGGGLGRFEYRGTFAGPEDFRPVEEDSLDEFLLERYTAYTARGHTRRLFRIWHPSWPQIPMEVEIGDDSLLKNAWPWFTGARLVGANYSPGFRDVWMGRAHRICPRI